MLQHFTHLTTPRPMKKVTPFGVRRGEVLQRPRFDSVAPLFGAKAAFSRCLEKAALPHTLTIDPANLPRRTPKSQATRLSSGAPPPAVVRQRVRVPSGG